MFCVIYYGEEPSSAEYLMWGIITICSLYGFFVGFYKFFFACFFEVDEEQESIPVNVPVTTSTITPPPVIKQPPKRKPVVTKQDWDGPDGNRASQEWERLCKELSVKE